MFAIKVTPNKKIPSMYYLLRDNEDFVVHIWTRKSEAEKHLAKLQEVVSQSVILEITDDIATSEYRAGYAQIANQSAARIGFDAEL